jgi:hypothetical protein
MIDLNMPPTMPADVPVVDVSSGPATAKDQAPMAKEIGKYVERHPALCFATAFVVGVTCAWWLKQA